MDLHRPDRIYGSLTADVQAVVRKGVLYEREGHPKPRGRWRKVRESKEALIGVIDRWEKTRTAPTAEAYRAKCLVSCLNERDNMWLLTKRRKTR